MEWACNVVEGNDMAISGRALKQRAYDEMKEFLGIAFYLWVVFALFAIYKSVILSENHIDSTSQGFAIVNALALGKVVLIAKGFHLGDLADHRPLIYPTLLKSALFTIVLGCFKILEVAAVGLYHGESFSQSLAEIGGGTLKGILSLMAIMFVVLIPFFAFDQLQGVLGKGKLRQLFLYGRKAFEAPERSLGANAPSLGKETLGRGASA